MNICKSCKKELNSRAKYYCSNQCQADYQYYKNIELWKKGLLTGYKGKTFALADWLRKYLWQKYENKCAECGWNIPHPLSGIPPLEVHHRDDNPSNNVESNLVLLCPCCHALTLSYRRYNKKPGRPRKQFIRKT